MRIAHLSDVHLQADYDHKPWARLGWRRIAAQFDLKTLRRAPLYAQAEDALRKLSHAAERAGAEHLILSGDLTALALDEEFEGVRRALSPWLSAQRITVVPGNHDVFTPGSIAKRRFERWFEDTLESELPELRAEGPYPIVKLPGDDVAIVGLTSARLPPLPGVAAGLVGFPQLQALEKIAAHRKVRGRAIYVVVHHAPLKGSGRRDLRIHGLSDDLALLAACRRAGVAAIVCGHLHARFDLPTDAGLRVVCGGTSTIAGREGLLLLEDEGGALGTVTPLDLRPAPELQPRPVIA